MADVSGEYNSNTIVMYFKVETSALKTPGFWEKVTSVGKRALGKLSGDPIVLEMGSPTDKLYVFQGEDNSHASVRIYSSGLLTLDVQHYIPMDVDSFVNLAYIRVLEKNVREILGDDCYEGNSMYAPIRRGQKVWSYMVTADERILEVDYDKIVFETDSRWQNIRIFHSKENGNVLYLDMDAMLGESDYIYTKTVAGIGQEDFTDKEVLILGGGDGGIIHELLKENPKFVTMAEIDEEVIKACRTHMRSVCGDTMDKYQGPNYKILIDDCIKVLHENITEGKKYDYVINDLTEFPVDKAVKGYNYDFETTSLITEMSLKVLKDEGKLLARGNCLSAVDYRTRFEGDLRKLNLKFKRKDVFVPSFHETYCLYEMWR